MEAGFSSPITCPVVIGRLQELTTLRLFIEQVGNGETQVVLVSGEAGIGKSRLVAEVKTFADAHGFLLFEGQCFQSDTDSPYAPLLDLFRTYFACQAPTSLSNPMNSFAAPLSRLLPELALMFPDLATLSASSSVKPQEEKRQLFAAMSHFLMEQAARQPVLLVVEDIHWCDDLSLDLLLHLARRCRQVPLLLLITYRSEELQPGLKRWLTQLDREHLAQECSLKRLSRDDVTDMLRVMLDVQQEVDADLLDTLYTRSEGNPFFVEELLKSILTSGELVSVDGTWKLTAHSALIPRSVEGAVQQRTAYLSTDAKRLVTLAAMTGRHFNVTLLQAILQYEEAQLLALLKELMAAQLVVEEAAEQFAFRHALTQEAITASLLLRERQGMHRTIVETLERLCSSSPTTRERCLEELASQSYAAGMWEQALTYAQEAGAKALSLYAQQTAIDHFTRAIEVAHYLSQMPLASLYLARGQAYETLGDFDRAYLDYERTLDAARTVQDRLIEWQSMMSIGFLWTGRNYEQAEVWFRQALVLAEQLADPALRVRSLNRLGNWLLNTGRIQKAFEILQEALHLLEARQNNQAMAETLEMLGMTTFFMGDPATAVKVYFGRVIELFRVLGDQQCLLSNLAAQALDSAPETIETTSSSLRTRDECMQDVEEALRLARQINSQTGQAFVEIATTGVLFSFGEFGSALAHAKEAQHIATTIEHQEWIAATYGMLGQLYLLLLEFDKAASCLEAGVADAQALGSAIWTKQLAPYLALVYIMRREFPRAEAVLKTIIPCEQQPGDFFERQAARAWGELALAQREANLALHIAAQLLVSTPGNEPQQPIPHLLFLKGQALLALKCLEEATRTLEEAKHGAKLRQAPSILWRVQLSLGQAYHLLKHEKQAHHEWSEARNIITKLASTIDETPLRESFLRTALALLPQERPLSQEAYTSRKYGGLSAREREVAALVAQGRSNREIAAILVVSERTAEAHVSNILGKLGLSTRAQVAAWAVEKGLTRTLPPTT